MLKVYIQFSNPHNMLISAIEEILGCEYVVVDSPIDADVLFGFKWKAEKWLIPYYKNRRIYSYAWKSLAKIEIIRER